MRHLIYVTNARNGEVLRVYPFKTKESKTLFWRIFREVCCARINGMGKPDTAAVFKENGAVIIGEKFPLYGIQPYIVCEACTDDRECNSEIEPLCVVKWASVQANQVMDAVDEYIEEHEGIS